MNNIYIIIIVVVVLLVIGISMGAVFSRRQRAKRYENKYGADYGATVKTMGDEKKAQTEMDSRMQHVGTLNIRELSQSERDGYLADWNAIQTKFIDEPAQATIEADHLIMKVMQTRNYPISDFDQRAADVSINYPDLVTNYRAAREIAVKNERHEASTEELRKALVYYRSLFDELLAPEAVVENK